MCYDELALGKFKAFKLSCLKSIAFYLFIFLAWMVKFRQLISQG